MSKTGPTPLPPTSLQHTRAITQSEAHAFLSAYLDRSTSDPSLQPNAVLSEQGPVSRNTSAAPSLVLHNLKRVQAGLGGEVLGKDLELEVFESEERERDGSRQKWFEEEIRGFGKGGRGTVTGTVGGKDGGEGWKDKWEYEVEQQPEELEGKGDDEVDVDVGAGKDGEEVGEDGMPVKIDREERKRRKKERRKEEKRAKTTKD